MTAIGFVLGSTLPPVLLPEVSGAIEAAGFHSVWMSEDYFMTGGVSGASIVLGATKTVKVGIGLLPIYVRHPALSAMEAGTIAGAFPERFRLGFGTGVKAWLDQMGVAHSAPLSSMRDTVDSVRSLLAGDTLDVSNRFTFDSVRLSYPPATVPPIYIGATGPKMTALAGEIADGVLMSVLCSPAFVRRSRDMIDRAAGADAPRRTISAFAIFSLAETTELARQAARPVIAEYLSLGANELTDEAGISDQVTAILTDGGRDRLEKEMPDDWIDLISISGDAPTCVRAIAALGDAGADEVALMPVDSTNLVQQIEHAGAALGLSKT
ncbi:MAG: 5,10-methylenetetrahydromethanopterin reductase [Pseudonocardiales bacterium]|nr:5,10-methylenetetrahydromethanopterin reductase [Pseudonocardiales bacterium]